MTKLALNHTEISELHHFIQSVNPKKLRMPETIREDVHTAIVSIEKKLDKSLKSKSKSKRKLAFDDFMFLAISIIVQQTEKSVFLQHVFNRFIINMPTTAIELLNNKSLLN